MHRILEYIAAKPHKSPKAVSRVPKGVRNSTRFNRFNARVGRLSSVERSGFVMDDEKSWDYQLGMTRVPRAIGQRRTTALLIGSGIFAILAFVIHLIS